MPAVAAAQAGTSQGSAERGDDARGRSRAGASGPHAPSSPSPTPREREEVAGGRVSRRPPAHRPVLPGTAPALRRRRADARWVDAVWSTSKKLRLRAPARPKSSTRWTSCSPSGGSRAPTSSCSLSGSFRSSCSSSKVLGSCAHAHAAARVMSCGMTLMYFRSNPAMYKAGLAQEPAVAHLRWVLGSAGHTLGRRM